MEIKTYKPIPRFNDHGAGCKGHANFMLDSTLENEADRNIVIHAVENYIPKDELKAIKEQEKNANKTNPTKVEERDGSGPVL